LGLKNKPKDIEFNNNKRTFNYKKNNININNYNTSLNSNIIKIRGSILDNNSIEKVNRTINKNRTNRNGRFCISTRRIVNKNNEYCNLLNKSMNNSLEDTIINNVFYFNLKASKFMVFGILKSNNNKIITNNINLFKDYNLDENNRNFYSKINIQNEYLYYLQYFIVKLYINDLIQDINIDLCKYLLEFQDKFTISHLVNKNYYWMENVYSSIETELLFN